MRHDRPHRTPLRPLHAGLFALVLALACGDDSTADDQAPDAATVCTMGQINTGCTCSAEQPPGLQSCSEDGQWGSCACPPPRADQRCTPRQQIRCFPCPGESERRVTSCREDGTYVCDCSGDGGSRVPPEDDAGQ